MKKSSIYPLPIAFLPSPKIGGKECNRDWAYRVFINLKIYKTDDSATILNVKGGATKKMVEVEYISTFFFSI